MSTAGAGGVIRSSAEMASATRPPFACSRASVSATWLGGGCCADRVVARRAAIASFIGMTYTHSARRRYHDIAFSPSEDWGRRCRGATDEGAEENFGFWILESDRQS